MFYTDYVAVDPTLQAVVVAHQGTDPKKLTSLANDAEIKHVAMNTTLFTSPACKSLAFQRFFVPAF